MEAVRSLRASEPSDAFTWSRARARRHAQYVALCTLRAGHVPARADIGLDEPSRVSRILDLSGADGLTPEPGASHEPPDGAEPVQHYSIHATCNVKTRCGSHTTLLYRVACNTPRAACSAQRQHTCNVNRDLI